MFTRWRICGMCLQIAVTSALVAISAAGSGCAQNVRPVVADALDESFGLLKPYIDKGLEADVASGRLSEADTVVIVRTVDAHQAAIDALRKQ
jgi:hypothetical protein